MQHQLNPNLTTPATFSYKDILVRKLVRAVACSVLSQLALLLSYIIIANTSIIQPYAWMSSVLETFTHFSTWLFVIIFSFIIFAQCLICAKDYVLSSSYCPTRFQQFVHILSLHNFTLLSLHVVVGGALVWQFLCLVAGDNRSLIVDCHVKQLCLVEDVFFLVLGGFWTGCYYFLRVYVASKHLVFPVIQQHKFLQFRSEILRLFKESLGLSLWPSFYFALFYYFWGSYLEVRFMYMFGLEKSGFATSALVYVYSWWFSSLYFFTMNLMRFFFYLFLTESVQFPLLKDNAYVLTLPEAIAMNNLPIVQNLACLDLYLLAQWSPLRRQVFFTLSQPGGHPHNWNVLTESVLKLFTEYIELLKKSTQLKETKKTQSDIVSPFAPIRFQSPTSPDLKYRNLRNMSVLSDGGGVVDVTQEAPQATSLQNLRARFDVKVAKWVDFFKVFLGINFFFGELPQVNIQKCLGNGHLIVWASQAIAELAAASLSEDKYGIVQKDLPVIITTLVQLKQSLDQLNKVPALARKVATLDDFNYKMKNAVAAAVKRSLFSICLHFGEYFNDFHLSKEVVQYLQVHVMLRNTCT